MPKYMVRASYTAAGAAGLLKEGGSARARAVETLAKSVGGNVEAMYWAFGADDFFCIMDMPDANAAAALALTVGASGSVSVTTVPLLSATDVDEVVGRRAEYRAPGA